MTRPSLLIASAAARARPCRSAMSPPATYASIRYVVTLSRLGRWRGGRKREIPTVFSARLEMLDRVVAGMAGQAYARRKEEALSAVGVRRLALDDVVGRESELDRIGGFFDGELGSLALWLEGVAGIGKTTLWRAGIELGRERGYRVLACQPTAAETAFSFAALGDLLANDVPEVLPELPAPQRRALEVALALAASEGPAVGEHVIGLALLSTLQLLAGRARVLVAVDDV